MHSLSRLVLVSVGFALLSGPAGAQPIEDPVGDFLSIYVGPHQGDLDVVNGTGVGVLGFGPAAQAGGGRELEGSWLNAVKIVTCPPDPYVVIATFQNMSTYMRGGTLIEGGSPSVLPPAVSRSAGHGIWERTGPDTFRVFFRFHEFDNLGRRVRITEVTTHPRLIEGDNPETPDVIEPYYLSAEGTNRITNLNPDDGTVINVIEGCNEATSRPVLFED